MQGEVKSAGTAACEDEGMVLEDRRHPAPGEDSAGEWRKRVDEDLQLDAKNALIQVAPMLHVTDRHFRMFMRQLTRKAELWTEMVVCSTVKHTHDLERHLGYSQLEHPIVCQLGGCNVEEMAQAASVVVKQYKYDKVNINVGCPSARVVDCGSFGAVLMKEPSSVAEMYRCMTEAIRGRPESTHGRPESTRSIISVKTRTGVDDNTSLPWLLKTMHEFSATGCKDYCVHARPALLGGLSPAKNRTVPPLDYDTVFALERQLGSDGFTFSLNGGVTDLDLAEALLKVPSAHAPFKSALQGVMIGRAAVDNPVIFAQVDKRIYSEKTNPPTADTRATILNGYMSYLEDILATADSDAASLKHAFMYLKPVVGLFHSTPASSVYRRMLDSQIRQMARTETPQYILTQVINTLSSNHNFSDVLHQPLQEDL